jgi:putative oxidoreductase
MKTKVTLDLIAALLILLFVYTAVSKWLDFEQFKMQLYSQALPRELATLLIWTLPGIELLTALLLLFERSRSFGFCVSACLMFLFTGYIALVLANYFGRTPCSCGGVIRALGWKAHLFFNIFFLLLSVSGIVFSNRERRIARL